MSAEEEADRQTAALIADVEAVEPIRFRPGRVTRYVVLQVEPVVTGDPELTERAPWVYDADGNRLGLSCIVHGERFYLPVIPVPEGATSMAWDDQP